MNMKNYSTSLAIVFVIILFLTSITSSRHITRPRHYGNYPHIRGGITRIREKIRESPRRRSGGGFSGKGSGGKTVKIAGSRLPDCGHTCGSCTPCRLVMVSFVCSSLERAQTCPMAYKCMCNNKSFPVP